MKVDQLVPTNKVFSHGIFFIVVDMVNRIWFIFTSAILGFDLSRSRSAISVKNDRLPKKKFRNASARIGSVVSAESPKSIDPAPGRCCRLGHPISAKVKGSNPLQKKNVFAS